MVYEIPQQLQHKERILFGLTFGQIGWALLFGLIILFILATDLSSVAKFTFALFPAVFGVLFMFFGFDLWIKKILFFLKFREAKNNTVKMQSITQIKKIKDDILYAKNNVVLLQVESINFGIKTEEEQESIITGFQKFLNSIDFPVQFAITTQNLNMDNYLKKLSRKATDKKLFKDFSKFMKSIIKEQHMRNRLFFLVIPESSNLEIQSKVCEERLKSMGLKTKRVATKGLLANVQTFFNDGQDRKEIKDKLKEMRKKSAKKETEKESKKKSEEENENEDKEIQYLIAPEIIVDKIDSLQINDKFCRVITANGYPRMVQAGFLDKIISSNDDFDISIHIQPFSIETMMLLLNKELQKQRADLFAEERKQSINPSLEIKYNDTRKVLEEMQKGNEKLFNVSLYINCKAETKEELNLLTKKVEAELNSIMIVPSNPLFRQLDAYRSMVPIANDHLKNTRNITTKALSAFFPFTSPFLTLEEEGVMLGLNKNKVPYIKDIYALSNANGVVLATSGSGKSYFTKLLIARQLLNNTKVIVIDPQGEYVGLTKQRNGELITISRTSETIINPLDLMGHDFIEKRLALMDLFKVMFGELSEIQKSILDKAVTETYAKKGINADTKSQDIKPPILGDLYKTLMRLERKAISAEKISYRAIINRLYMYTDGVFGFLNKQSKINFNKDFVCFNIGNMPKQVKPVIMFLILDYVYMKMKEGNQRKLLVVDEAWSLLRQTEEAGYIFEIVKTCRKFNLGLLLITQDVADLINSKAGHAVLANSSYSFLLRQKPAIIDYVTKTFNLSQPEKEYLLTATQGKGILILDNEHQELEVVASPKEHNIITTNPNEAPREETKEEDERVEVNIKLDSDRGLYYGEKLNQDDKLYLTNHGYKLEQFVPIGQPRQRECWIKKNKIESLTHTFLVHNIKEELEKRNAKEIEVSITKEADITFKNKQGKTVAIEVETGLSYKKNKTEFLKKFNELEKQFKNNLIVVLTNKDYKIRYQNNLPNIKTILRKDIPTILDTLL